MLVALGVRFCLMEAAHADITPIIMPTPHPAQTMVTGATGKPSPDDDGFLHTPTTLGSPSVAPPITAAPFGGMLG